MNGVALPALRADSPVGFLAALGVARVLGCRLHWDAAGSAVASGGPQDPEALCDALVGALAGSAKRGAALPPDPKKLAREDWLAVLADAPEWACALAGEGRDGPRPTALCLTAGNQKFVEVALKSAQLVDAEHAPLADARARVVEALHGPWRYSDTVHSMGLDPAGKRDGAFSATRPETSPNRGVAAAYWLAFLGLPLVPVVGGTTVGVRDRHWQWATTAAPAGAAALRSLQLTAAHLRQCERDAAGIRLWRARIDRSGSYGWLLSGALVREP